jgi:hypothetical protein
LGVTATLDRRSNCPVEGSERVGEGFDAGGIIDAYRMVMIGRGGGSYTPADEGPLFEALKEALEEGEAQAAMSLELDGAVWILLVVGGGVRLVRPKEGVAEVRFLGPLCGRYMEYYSYEKEVGRRTVLRFEDDRIPGGTIEIIVDIPLSQGIHLGGGARTRIREAERLRPYLRKWAEEPTREK